MTPLNSLLGSQASAILVLTGVAMVLLVAVAAALDYLSGAPHVLASCAFAEVRSVLFVWIGLPAVLVLLAAGGVLGALTSGMVRTDGGTRVLLGAVNGAFLVAAVICGACSPIARRWRLAVGAFAVGLAVLFALLALISALSFDEAGLLTAISDRVVFGVAIGGILLGVGLCGCGVVALLCYVAERTALLMNTRHHTPAPRFGGAGSNGRGPSA